MHRHLSSSLTIFLVAIGLSWASGCSSELGHDNANSDSTRGSAFGVALTNVSAHALSYECPAGGVDIETGVDQNANGILDADEVSRVVTVCDGTSGKHALVETEALTGTEECASGGIRIRSGLDADANGLLDDAEVLRNDVVCHGAAGADGVTTLVLLSEVEPGETCPAGGVSLKTGLDVNGDRELADGEISQEATICNGVPGEPGAAGTSCTATRDEESGTTTITCEDGTTAVVHDGMDGVQGPRGDAGPQGAPGSDGENCTVVDNGDGTMTITCGTSSVTVSDGAQGSRGDTGSTGQNGADGTSSLIRLEPELGGPICPYSGTRILSGVDDNGDGELQDTEVDDEAIVCSSTPGDCAPDYHAQGDGSCISNIRDCVVSNGTGVETWTGNGWGSCMVVSCNTGFYKVSNTCMSDTRECVVLNGTGTETWTGSEWGSCTVVSCNTGYHTESDSCMSDTRDCEVLNGTGTETWTGSGWGSCTVVSCNMDYHEESNSCMSDTRDCVMLNGTGAETWTGSGWGDCTLVSCNMGYHEESDSCTSDTRDCVVLNGAGTETWTGSGWGTCIATTCENGYALNEQSGSCEGDGMAPSPPTNLTATAVGSTQINLTWGAATAHDMARLSGYKVERCLGESCTDFEELAPTTSNTAFNSGYLTTGTPYSFRVRAYDNLGSHSSYSNVVSATTGGTTFRNTRNYQIRRYEVTESIIRVSGLTGNAPSTTRIDVRIVYPDITGLNVLIIAPNGRSYYLHNNGGTSSMDNIDRFFRMNLSSASMNGIWKLRVWGSSRGSYCYIDSWSITF